VSQVDFDAFAALLTAAGVTWYDAKSTDGATGGFVVFYADDGNREQVDLANVNPIRYMTIQTTCNGDTAEQARLISKKVADAVEGVRPVIAGRSCGQIYKLISRSDTRDDDIPGSRFYAVTQWRWYSTNL